MKHYLQLIISIIVFSFSFQRAIAANELPPFIHVCHRDHPNLDKCMMAAVEDLRPYLITGVPEYKIPSLEPLILHDLISEEAAGMKITTSNVSTYGCSDYFVRAINVNMDTTHIFEIYLDLPKIRILAHYNIDGKLLLLPVKGDGMMEANITDCVSKTILKSEVFEKDGQTHLRFISSKISVKVGGGQIEMKSLFNGDRVLLGVINDVINKNLNLFLKELMPVIENALGEVMLDIANKIVEPFTFKQLFPH